ncbi:hypothetical protein [Methylocaldum sp. 14B]|uniref:hypothetical protein n=1 Tax=Methylocaldum sp. 14B TaxID=1912213 RepID=UPI000989EC8C|nr:hypothetical protein [Methylocaldum sp. 14B]
MQGIYAGDSPSDFTENEFTGLFGQHRRVRAMELARLTSGGRCPGFGLVGIKGREARAAISVLKRYAQRGNCLRISEERPRGRSGGKRRRLTADRPYRQPSF